MDYYMYGNNKNPSHYNYCDSSSSSMQNNNFGEMKCLEKKKKKKHTCGSKEVRLSTDPQSVAARERRHRISERFKILQSLVPGGTKMDTVTMLEEAILYVKFLKTQIWLLNHHHQSQSQYQDINFNNIINNNHVVVDDVYEQPSAYFDNDHLACDDHGRTNDIHHGNNIYLQDNNNYEYHPIMPGPGQEADLGFQDCWFQVEGGQQSMDFDDVAMESW